MRKRKSVRGCVVGADISVLNLVVIKKGDVDIPGLNDTVKPRRLGPKRASKIRKLFNLEKKDDVRKYVIRRKIEKENKKPYFKAPKIQRLVTPRRLQHKRQIEAVKRKRSEKSRKEALDYQERFLKKKRPTVAAVKKTTEKKRKREASSRRKGTS